VLDGEKWRPVMGDDYCSVIELIACVKDVVDSMYAMWQQTYLCTVTSANKTCKSTLAGPSLLWMFCSMRCFVAIQFAALVNELHIGYTTNVIAMTNLQLFRIISTQQTNCNG
jgi:hypothetical protein